MDRDDPAAAPLDRVLARLEQVLARVEAVLPPPPDETDWSAVAWRWRSASGGPALGPRGAFGWLEPIRHLPAVRFSDVQHVERQKDALVRNTRQFLAGAPANHVLMTGARGTGKSSLVKACLAEYARDGLRMIEVDRADLHHLPAIVDLVAGRPERFVVFCDDLTFEDGDAAYKALKVALDGGLATASDNVLVYATSNRRHLMPERMRDNEAVRMADDGEIHPGEAIEEKISLSERFGLWLSFHPFRQDDYLSIVAHWLRVLGTDEPSTAWRDEALRFALERGSRSGRVAWQYARDRAGRRALDR